ncbi:hypothetical protein BUALT_Bualt09G0028200 [Buddleja alternifolia]|uniref:IST1-like protein n=1 Tax=Buddleja alternifolia TaxID=168488 RepID=A0AAV6X7L4_9LAMI|nr:hypothetical protein BUALT_Bualt09G0028200 [Buddleja alternifolia]
MKKSKFLQNSKDMLSRSFNPSKCKISLRLAGSRLKLLRNKKEVQLKQMKREIAQLLESGQDQTARIRVEHVIREEKMMAAYDLLEIYSELIVARLPIIESQKNCPIDLKEAIASIVFASPRCGDVPELLDVRKHFTAKYGKEFTTAAIELRPQCGASRLLVEKLSATAPDVQTKTKILSAIAEEHNIKWDTKPFEETDSVPPSDLLNGPSSNTMHVETPHFETSHAQAPPSNNEMYSSPLKFSHHDSRTSLQSGKLASGQNSGVNEKYQPEARPPVLGDERWNMEFKDATSAAQAAAESAQRASIAARAAAEYANRDRLMRQYSTESHNSNASILKDDGPETHPNSQFSKESLKRPSPEQTGSEKEQIDGIKGNDPRTATHGCSGEYSQSASVKSKASIDEDSLDEVSRDEMGKKNQSFKYEAEVENCFSGKDDYVREERIGKQPSISPSHSHSSISDDLNIFPSSEDQKFENNVGENPFASGIDKGGIHGEASQTSSHEPASLFFDKYDSDSDGHGFDLGPSYDEHESEFHMPSLGKKSPERLSMIIDSWSPKSSSNKIVNSTSSSLFFSRENSSNDFSENMTSKDGSKLDNFAPVTFDDSESDEEMNTRHTGMEDTRDILSEHNKSGESVIPQLKDKSQKSVGSLLEESQMELNDTGNESGPEIEQRLNFGKLTGGIRHKKGYNCPKFLNNQSDKSLSIKKESEETTEMVTILDHKKNTRKTPEMHSLSDSDSSEVEESLQKSSDEEDILYSAGKEVKTKSSLRASNSIFGSDNSDLDEDPPKESITRKSNILSGISRRTKGSHSDAGMNRKPTTSYTFENPKKAEPQIKNSSKWENYDEPTSGKVDCPRTNPSSWETSEKTDLVQATNPRMQESNSDLDEDPPKESITRKSNLLSGISRRTKGSHSDAGMNRKPTTSYTFENPKKSESQIKNSTKWENYDEPTSGKVDCPRTNPSSWETSEKTDLVQSTNPRMQESKISQKSSVIEEPSVISESPKTFSNEDESTKNASHVHPKLPDYDTLFQSLRMGRS